MPVIVGQAGLVQAARHLAAGELVAFPTETVYGLGARADDDAAVARIFAAKGRPSDHPLIVHVADVQQAEYFAAEIGAPARRLMAAFWPGPLTLIVRRRSGRGDAAAAGQDSIGLRMPAHPVARALLHEVARLGVAGVAAPSANRFGRVSATTAAHVVHEFGPDLWVLDGGACPVGIESTIVDCTRARPALLRPGQLGRGQIEQALGSELAAAGSDSPRAPGSLASHYAPAAAVCLWDRAELERRLQSAPPAGQGIAVYSRLVPAANLGWSHWPMPSDAAAAAHELFAVLREIDASGAGAIWVERPPPDAQWDGVRDRLERAAA